MATVELRVVTDLKKEKGFPRRSESTKHNSGKAPLMANIIITLVPFCTDV